MTDICERRVVRRPEHEASHCLAAFVAERRGGDGTARITLRLPFKMFSTWEASIERRVIATIYPLHSLGDRYPTYSVSWSTQGAGPFPKFAGALAVEKLLRDDCFGLILSGHYEPPLGKAGALFDAVLGHRIARCSAQDLLRLVAARAENASIKRGRRTTQVGATICHSAHEPAGIASRNRGPTSICERLL